MKFIYVFTEADKEALEKEGFELVKENVGKNPFWIFNNNKDKKLNFELSNFWLSNTISF